MSGRRLVSLALVFAVVLAVGACSSDSDGDTATTTTTKTSQSTTTGDETAAARTAPSSRSTTTGVKSTTSAASGGRSTTTAAEPTSTTTAPPSSATPTTTTSRPAEVAATTPDAAAQGLYAAWKNGDRAGAAKFADPEAINELFSRPFTGPDEQFLGCDLDGVTYSCTYLYEGGSSNFRTVGDPDAGYRVVAIGQEAD